MTKRALTPAELAARLAEHTAACRAAHPVRLPRKPVSRDGIGGNGGPPLDASRPSRRGTLHRVGMSLYGERWKEEAAAPFGVSARTLRRYVADVDPVAAPDSVIVAARRVCLAKIRELQDCIERLDAVVPPTPAPVIHAGVDPEAAAWFLDAVSASMALPPGTPTFVRDVLAVRMPARGRLVQADVVICDGSTFTIEIDRQRAGDPGHIRFVTDDDTFPRVWFDAEGGVWRRDLDRPSEPQGLRRAAHRPTPAPKPAPAAAPAPAVDPRQVDLVDYIAAKQSEETL